MYVNTETPDGYLVDNTGKRIGESDELVVLPSYIELPLEVFLSEEYQNDSIYIINEKLVKVDK